MGENGVTCWKNLLYVVIVPSVNCQLHCDYLHYVQCLHHNKIHQTRYKPQDFHSIKKLVGWNWIMSPTIQREPLLSWSGTCARKTVRLLGKMYEPESSWRGKYFQHICRNNWDDNQFINWALGVEILYACVWICGSHIRLQFHIWILTGQNLLWMGQWWKSKGNIVFGSVQDG